MLGWTWDRTGSVGSWQENGVTSRWAGTPGTQLQASGRQSAGPEDARTCGREAAGEGMKAAAR